jgi:1,4-alpha-glucan branching enzyme
MGSILFDGGAAFRVWAPFAEKVSVVGTFNDWSATASPLASEGNGYWSADVAGPKTGDQYKFVLQNGGQVLWRTNPYAREITNPGGNSTIHDRDFDWSGDEFTMPPWNELVIYEMHVGTFNDLPGGEPGTFKDVIAKLPYLRDLGINAIEIMPVLEFPMSFSWGYNPAHPFAVETALGGPQGLQGLVKAAHQHGIAVIMDVVYNHFGPGDLDLWQFDGWHAPGQDGGIYFYDNARANTPWGDTRPDYGRPEVRQFLRDNVLHWLQKFRVDGLRFDATAYIRNKYGNEGDSSNDLPDGWSLLQWINDEFGATQPWKISIAEDLRNNEWITRDTGAGGAGFDTQWESEFVHPVRAALITQNDSDRDMGAIARALQHRYGTDAFERVIYTESHDEVANGHARVPSEIWPGNAASWFSKKRSTLGAALVFTAPGIPMIFQGQEFLEDEYFRDDDPLDWAKAETFSGIRQLYTDLIRLRRNWFDRTRGLRGQHVNVFHVNHADKVVAFHRWDQGGPGDDVVIVANFGNRGYSDYRLGLPHPGLWRVRFNSDWRGYSEDFGDWGSFDTWADEGGRDDLGWQGSVGLGPYSVVILSQDP